MDRRSWCCSHMTHSPEMKQQVHNACIDRLSNRLRPLLSLVSSHATHKALKFLADEVVESGFRLIR